MGQATMTYSPTITPHDPLPEPLTVLANWAALAVFGRETRRGRRSGWTLDGVELSERTFALMFAEIHWLMTLFDTGV